ncbi:MAG: putative metal-binding motif-containing protein [Parcubacteria group bacterium]
MQKFIRFLKYHNTVPIILGVVLLGTAGVFANEDVRNTVIGQKIENITGIDNAQLLAVDLDNFDQALRIEDVTQDNENYYINYIFRTLAIKDNVWQEVFEQNTLTVGIKSMVGKDLGLYVQGELAEVADWELNHLKRVQSEEKEKGITVLTASVDYTGLIGLVLDARDKILPGYKPVVTQEICDGLDNNKNGQIDEGFEVGKICLAGNGVCRRQGIYNCSSGGKSVCSAMPGQPGLEICDSIDNNCDGRVDEENICSNDFQKPQEVVCTPSFEICNGVDDDCDDEIDEMGVCNPKPVVNPPIELTSTTTEAAATTEAATTEPIIEQPPIIEELPTEPATTTEEWQP